ncbi:hypothetical protein Sgleb_22630 [Streptomyces glebosus]|uniref:Uncharacterized protein n=1 Tax=Streptomyces glebosus TaxID=249580 RepID=A0A640SVV1_9ACTN|nr:hypothetical protein Sgleb_22630 [Streptomyces glebosus]GHG76663.1 hypothetical protein GCM10010513_51970 [Streptomyces glebosus]
MGPMVPVVSTAPFVLVSPREVGDRPAVLGAAPMAQALRTAPVPLSTPPPPLPLTAAPAPSPATR